jgi:hypothetical protein
VKRSGQASITPRVFESSLLRLVDSRSAKATAVPGIVAGIAGKDEWRFLSLTQAVTTGWPGIGRAWRRRWASGWFRSTCSKSYNLLIHNRRGFARYQQAGRRITRAADELNGDETRDRNAGVVNPALG